MLNLAPYGRRAYLSPSDAANRIGEWMHMRPHLRPWLVRILFATAMTEHDRACAPIEDTLVLSLRIGDGWSLCTDGVVRPAIEVAGP